MVGYFHPPFSATAVSVFLLWGHLCMRLETILLPVTPLGQSLQDSLRLRPVFPSSGAHRSYSPTLCTHWASTVHHFPCGASPPSEEGFGTHVVHQLYAEAERVFSLCTACLFRGQKECFPHMLLVWAVQSLCPLTIRQQMCWVKNRQDEAPGLTRSSRTLVPLALNNVRLTGNSSCNPALNKKLLLSLPIAATKGF